MDGLSPAVLTSVTLALCVTQAGVMLADELIYHRRRKLGLWETFGHPLDTLAFLGALSLPATQAPTPRLQLVYAGLALVSMLLITKDEWVHARECKPTENWLHALLFVLHAPVLTGVWLLWRTAPEAPLLAWLPPMVGGWMLFQLAYWTDYHARRKSRRSLADAVTAGPTHGEQRLLRRPGRSLV